MTPLDAAALFALLFLPFHWLVKRHFDELQDPAYLRARGVVIVQPSALEGHTEPVGSYMGREIWRSVKFKGMEYRFDRVVAPKERERIVAGELYVEPGLVFRALSS